MLKYLLITLGTLSLGIGITGMFIPGLPTTPFVLLTAGLYARSSDSMYQWLISNRRIGPYIQEFRRTRGLTKSVKIYSIVMMWLMILTTILLFLDYAAEKIIVISIGLVGTVVMAFIIPTGKPKE